MKLLIREVCEYELTKREGERLEDVYQRFLDDSGIYLTGITERDVVVENDDGTDRNLEPWEERAFQRIEARS